MDELVVSKKSMLYRLAKLGGFKDHVYASDREGYIMKVPGSSCSFGSSVLMGIIGPVGMTVTVMGMLLWLVFSLVYMGSPEMAVRLAHTQLFAFCSVGGLLGWAIVVLLTAIFLMIWYIEHIHPRVCDAAKWVAWKITQKATRSIGARKHIKDYLDGICKPVKVID